MQTQANFIEVDNIIININNINYIDCRDQEVKIYFSGDTEPLTLYLDIANAFLRLMKRKIKSTAK